MSCVVMRIVCAERRTLPSRTAPTFSLRAIVPMSASFPLNEKADVRAETCSSLMRAREFSTSSVNPSEKYSCSLSPLMFTNGNTAIECGGGEKSGAATLAEAVGGFGDDVGCLEIQNLSIAKYARAPRTNTATPESSAGVDRQNAATRSLVSGVAADPA